MPDEQITEGMVTGQGKKVGIQHIIYDGRAWDPAETDDAAVLDISDDDEPYLAFAQQTRDTTWPGNPIYTYDIYEFRGKKHLVNERGPF